MNRQQTVLKPLLCALVVAISSLMCAPPTFAIMQEDDEAGVVTNSDHERSSLEQGDSLPAFELQDALGQRFDSGQFKSKPLVVVFFGVECPLVRFYATHLPLLAENYPEQDVQWIGINSNQHDSLIEIQQFAKTTGLGQTGVPLLKDPGNKIADLFGAVRTPEVFFFDTDHKLQYRGAIDDRYSYGQQKGKPDHTYLADAIDSMVAENTIEVSKTEPVGCIIGRRLAADDSSTVTYSNQISRIIRHRCLTCHRVGEVAPFAMTDFDEVVGWAEMIEEVAESRRMPPWHANPEHGDFKNDASLTKTELEQIKQWVAAGAPEGDPAELPAPIEFVTGWGIGEPDVVIPMADQPYQVPATGVIPYQYFVVDPGFTEDKWITAAECRIGNRAVVHHVIVMMHDEDKSVTHGGSDSQWVTATAPGSPPLILPDGFAKLIPAGTKLVFQMHYTPNGTAQSDISSVGFKFTDRDQVKKEVSTRQAINTKFKIPPHAANHTVTADYRFRQNALMISMFPHMHLRGKSFRYTAKYPDGKSEILLDVPNYDFNWQNGYEFAEPKLMPAGTVLECVAQFDNSKNNFANPNPGKAVGWGDQTWDEMMIGYFNMALADQDLTSQQ